LKNTTGKPNLETLAPAYREAVQAFFYLFFNIFLVLEILRPILVMSGKIILFFRLAIKPGSYLIKRLKDVFHPLRDVQPFSYIHLILFHNLIFLHNLVSSSSPIYCPFFISRVIFIPFIASALFKMSSIEI
jgi:hypothetical protein